MEISCAGNLDRMQFIDLKAQYEALKDRVNMRVQSVFDHGLFIMGPEVEELESQLASYVGVKNVVTCGNGTDALLLALMASGIGEGDAVFVPTFTFFASAEVVSLVRATPVFVDSDLETFNICSADLEEKIQAVLKEGRLNIKCIIAVDLFGLPADYSSLREVAHKYGLKIIEDAAQSFGGAIGEHRACSLGDIATTSFFPSKPLGCYGDGGAVFTNDDSVAELMRSLRVHGKGKDKYDNLHIGLNSRLDTVQAAILLEKLTVFPAELEERARIASTYNLQLPEVLQIPHVPFGYKSAWAQYTLVAKTKTDRSMIMSRLAERDIPTMIYYKRCVHEQPAYHTTMADYGPLERAEQLANRVFSLPIYPYLQAEMVENILVALRDAVIND